MPAEGSSTRGAPERTGSRPQRVGPRPLPIEPYLPRVSFIVNAPDRQPRPSLVLVVIDALRPDHLGCYGCPRGASPALDRIAAEGILFEDAAAPATWTLPAVAALLASNYPLLMGCLTDTGEPILAPDHPDFPSLPPLAMPVSLQGELRDLGYTTLACVGGGFLDPSFGLAQGFDWYWAPPRTSPTTLADQLAELQRKLSAEPAQPFFLLLHTYAVHDYFQGSRHCLDRFDHGYQGPLTDPEVLSRTVLSGRAEGLSPADLQYLSDVYDGEILYADQQLGPFLDWLLGGPAEGNAVLVITSDHGEAFGGRGALHHGHAPHRSVVQVPLLVRLPGPPGPARRLPLPVSLVDVMPTLVELAGGSPPPGLAGQSLVPLLRGEAPGSPRPAFATCGGPIFLAREGRWWYYTLLANHEEKLYDLEADPHQSDNIAPLRPDQLLRMRRALASLVMYGARGYRLAIAGRRPRPLAVELECDGRFSYLVSPTLWQEGALSVTPITPGPSSPGGQRVHINVPAGDDPHVILFEAASPEDTVLVSARIGRRNVPARRFRLGARQVAPERVPVKLAGLPPASSLLADTPPAPTDSDDWGLWLWLPTALARPPSAAGPALTSEERAALEDQLRALGYLE